MRRYINGIHTELEKIIKNPQEYFDNLTISENAFPENNPNYGIIFTKIKNTTVDVKNGIIDLYSKGTLDGGGAEANERVNEWLDKSPLPSTQLDPNQDPLIRNKQELLSKYIFNSNIYIILLFILYIVEGLPEDKNKLNIIIGYLKHILKNNEIIHKELINKESIKIILEEMKKYENDDKLNDDKLNEKIDTILSKGKVSSKTAEPYPSPPSDPSPEGSSPLSKRNLNVLPKASPQYASPSEATPSEASEDPVNDKQNMGEISNEEKVILNKQLKQKKLEQEKKDKELAQQYQKIFNEYEKNLKGDSLIKPEIEPVGEGALWNPPDGSNNGVNKCWLNAPLYTILQNRYIRDTIIEHGGSSEKNVFSETIKNLLKPDSGVAPAWNQEKYSEIIRALKNTTGDVDGLIKLNPEANDPLTNVDYGDSGREQFITDLINGVKSGNGITKSFYYDARHTLHYLENVLKKIGINIYIINTIPFGKNAVGPYVDCNKYGKTETAAATATQDNKIWKGCVSISEEFKTKLIGLVQSYNIYHIDPNTKESVQGEAGHYRSFIPIKPTEGDFNGEDFNANYEWVKKDALHNFRDENVNPESGHFAHSYYLFLEKPNVISTSSGGGKRRVMTNKKRKGRRVNRTEKKNRRSIRKGNRRSRKKGRTPKKRISNNERTLRKRIQRNGKIPKKRTLKKRR